MKPKRSYEDFLRIFREEIDEHLHWQDAQTYYGLLSLEPGWRVPATVIFETLSELETKIPSQRFKEALDEFYWSYGP